MAGRVPFDMMMIGLDNQILSHIKGLSYTRRCTVNFQARGSG